MIRAIKTRRVLGSSFIHKKQLAISVATILFQNNPISSHQQMLVISSLLLDMFKF